MRILYGVQGTGNGHITRARSMANAFADSAIEVDWIFSGRAAEDYFDMDCFGDYRCFDGLTYVSEQGSIQLWKTVKKLNVRRFLQDVNSLDLSGYDLVISDFDPVSAWAAKKSGKPSIGLSHQCAFQYDIPKKGNNFFTDFIMKWFAPVDTPIGMHWHHFNGHILPPMIERDCVAVEPTVENQYLVYFPFQTLDYLIDLVEPFSDCHFFIYHSVKDPIDMGHIHIRPFSRVGFQQDLQRVNGVICGAGFELPSEGISLGKRLLVQPVRGQLEQLSNGLALEQLKLASVCENFSHDVLRDWLRDDAVASMQYPDVSAALVQWLQKKDFNNVEPLVRRLWNDSAATTENLGRFNKTLCV